MENKRLPRESSSWNQNESSEMDEVTPSNNISTQLDPSLNAESTVTLDLTMNEVTPSNNVSAHLDPPLNIESSAPVDWIMNEFILSDNVSAQLGSSLEVDSTAPLDLTTRPVPTTESSGVNVASSDNTETLASENRMPELSQASYEYFIGNILNLANHYYCNVCGKLYSNESSLSANQLSPTTEDEAIDAVKPSEDFDLSWTNIT
ncbi:hypothetical protein Aperf_G00000013814 [Anoplocephala perfoliata]